MIYNILITLGMFLFMECVAWATHKYVMHGFMWYFHEDHHEPGHKHLFEKNDIFFVIYATPAIILMYLGAEGGMTDYRFAIGLGITMYGFAYFFVHDIFIHQRTKWLKKTDNIYFRAIRKAHKVHHKHLGKEQGECFGMLLAPIKYFKESMRSTRSS